MLYFIWKADTFESSTSMRYFECFLWVCVCNPVVQWAVEWLSNNSYATAVLPVGEAKTINSSPMLLQPSLTLVLFPPIFPNHLPPSIRSPLIHVMPFFNLWVCCWLYLFQIWIQSRISLISQTASHVSAALSSGNVLHWVPHSICGLFIQYVFESKSV